MAAGLFSFFFQVLRKNETDFMVANGSDVSVAEYARSESAMAGYKFVSP